MQSRFDRLLFCVAVAGLSATAAAAAQTGAFKPVTAQELARNPGAYLGQPIELDGAFCYAANKGYFCMTTEPLSVAADAMPSGVRKSIIDDECGEFDALEQSPGCKFSLRFLVKSVETTKGAYVRGGKAVQGQIKVLHTETAEPVGGRDH